MPLASVAEEEAQAAAAAAGGAGSAAPPAAAAAAAVAADFPVSVADLSDQQQQQMLLQLLHPLLLKQFKGSPPLPLTVPASLEMLWQEQGTQQRLEAAAAARAAAAEQAAAARAAAQAKPAPFDEEARGRGFAKAQPYVPGLVFRHPNPLSAAGAAAPATSPFAGLPGSGGSSSARSAGGGSARQPAPDAAPPSVHSLRVGSRELPEVQRYLGAHGAQAAAVELPAPRAASPQRSARPAL